MNPLYIRDSFRIQKSKINVSTMKKAKEWKPSDYPLATILKYVERDDEPFIVNSKLYEIDCDKFNKVTRENLIFFIDFLKNEKVKAKIIKDLSLLTVSNISDTPCQTPFIKAKYVPYLSHNEIYHLEDCPIVDLIKSKPIQKVSETINFKITDETTQWLVDKVLSHNVALSNISSTPPNILDKIEKFKALKQPEPTVKPENPKQVLINVARGRRPACPSRAPHFFLNFQFLAFLNFKG